VLLELAFVAVLVLLAELEDEESLPPPPPPHAVSRLSSRQGRAFFKARDFMLDSSNVSSCYQNLNVPDFQGMVESM
jgi:hypothetical protein